MGPRMASRTSDGVRGFAAASILARFAPSSSSPSLPRLLPPPPPRESSPRPRSNVARCASIIPPFLFLRTSSPNFRKNNSTISSCSRVNCIKFDLGGFFVAATLMESSAPLRREDTNRGTSFLRRYFTTFETMTLRLVRSHFRSIAGSLAVAALAAADDVSDWTSFPGVTGVGGASTSAASAASGAASSFLGEIVVVAAVDGSSSFVMVFSALGG
mmetsp:Transcript_5874/g.16959  ORF Transcript_5874/g.16959 Transcript_5874/m.16959 type:complete len:215 (-) Transcript_5874:144-788(-)